MGNVIYNTISTQSHSTSNTISLWDILTHLLKRYVVSSFENDEFLCNYLLSDGTEGRMRIIGQRAIEFDPLPSRYEDFENERHQKDTANNNKKKAKIIECISSDDDESLSSSEYEDAHDISSHNNPSIDEEYHSDSVIALYSAYGAISGT